MSEIKKNNIELRDLFALHAMVTQLNTMLKNERQYISIEKHIAFNSYTLADAMMAARDRKDS